MYYFILDGHNFNIRIITKAIFKYQNNQHELPCSKRYASEKTHNAI